MTGKHIFISYRSSESAFAVKLANALQGAGIAVWMDRLGGIRAGDDWVMALQTGVNDSAALVAALSPAYAASTYCRRELKRADSLGKAVFPVLLQDLSPQDLPIEIQEKQYVDFRQWQDSAVFTVKVAELVDALKTVIKPHPQVSPSLPPPDAQTIPTKAAEDHIDAAQIIATQLASRPKGMHRVKSLQRRLTSLTEDLDAAETQLDYTVSKVDSLRLSRQIESILTDIEDVESQLMALKALE